MTKSLQIGLSQTLVDRPIKIYNKTSDKLSELRDNYSTIIQAKDVVELANDSSFVLLIIPHSAIVEMDTKFTDLILKSNSILVSCANYLSIDILDKYFPQKNHSTFTQY